MAESHQKANKIRAELSKNTYFDRTLDNGDMIFKDPETFVEYVLMLRSEKAEVMFPVSGISFKTRSQKVPYWFKPIINKALEMSIGSFEQRKMKWLLNPGKRIHWGNVLYFLAMNRDQYEIQKALGEIGWRTSYEGKKVYPYAFPLEAKHFLKAAKEELEKEGYEIEVFEKSGDLLIKRLN